MADNIVNFHTKRNYGRIGKDKVVTLKYAVMDTDSGETIEFRDDLIYLHGGYGGAPAKIEQELEGLGVDEKNEVTLSPDEGFGLRDPGLVMTIPKTELPSEAHQIGARIEGESPEGKTVNFTVVKVTADGLVVDGNHPLSGRNLRFIFEVTDIRPATRQELEAGSALRLSAETSVGPRLNN